MAINANMQIEKRLAAHCATFECTLGTGKLTAGATARNISEPKLCDESERPRLLIDSTSARYIAGQESVDTVSGNHRTW